MTGLRGLLWEEGKGRFFASNPACAYLVLKSHICKRPIVSLITFAKVSLTDSGNPGNFPGTDIARRPKETSDRDSQRDESPVRGPVQGDTGYRR